MQLRGRVLFGLIQAICLIGVGHAFGAEPKPVAPTAEKPVAPEASDGVDASRLSNIEDATLADLLGLDLEEQLGETEAVSRTNESLLRAPATVTTIDATQIRLLGATTVPDALRGVPGVAVIRSAPGNYIVSLRGSGGLASNNIILLIDGIPINNPLDGTVSWDLVPLHVEDIERIEVVRGPVSPIYGANAYTGVVNIVSRTSAGLPPSYTARIRAGVDPQEGSLGALSGRFLHITKDLTLKWFITAEHDSTSRKPATPTTEAFNGDPKAKRVGMTTALAFTPTETQQISFEAGQVWSERSSMDHLALDSVNQSQRMLFGRALYALKGGAGFFDSLSVWAQGVTVATNADQNAETGFSYDGARSRRGVAGTDLVLNLGNIVSAQLGGQGSLERIEAPFVHPNANGTVRPTYGFYGGLKASPLPTLDLVATGRYDLAPIADDLDFSYRASAVYHTDTWGLRLTAASAFRTPTYVEAAGRFIDPATGLILLEGTDTISAPRNTALELGATFSPDSRLIIAPTVYVSRLTNLMIEDFESLVRRSFRNDPNPRTFLGAEIEATWQVNDNLTLQPSFSLLKWLEASERIDTNVGVPSQNSTFLGGLQARGLFGNETWGYGAGISVASARDFNVRTGIPPVVISKTLPTTANLTASLEHEIVSEPNVWISLRGHASLPNDEAESPLPLAAPLGQSIVLGLSVRRE